jgi:chromosome segregation ATPase
VRIRTLDLINWMKISEAHFVFTDGINVLFGDNGEGKTSVFEAIRFMLTDSKRAESWKDYIKNDGSKEFDIRMSVQMSDDESDIIKFHYKGTESKGSVDRDIIYGEEKHIGADASEFLRRKFDQDMIENTAFSLQDGVSIVSMQPAKRREIFKKIFNSEFPNSLAKLSEDKDKNKTLIIANKATIDLLQKATYQLYRIIEVDESELNKLKEELQQSQASEVDKERLKLYSSRLTDINAKQTELNKLIESKGKHLFVVDALRKDMVEAILKKKVNEERVITLEEGIKEGNKILESLIEQKEEFVKTLDLKKESEKYAELATLSTNLFVDIITLKKYIEAHKKGKCETCGQDCDLNKIPEFESQIVLLDKEYYRVKKEMQDNTTRVSLYEKAVKDWASKISDKQRELSIQLNRKEDSKKWSEASENQIKSIESQITRELELSAAIELNIVMINEKIAELQQWCDSNRMEIKSNIRSVNAIQKEIDAILASIADSTTKNRLNEETLKKKEADKKLLDEAILNLNNAQLKDKEFESVKHIFEVDFPGYINLQACKILENYINAFFKGVKTNFVVQLNQDAKGINFFYKADNEPKWNKAKMTSGYEETMLTAGFKCSVGYAYGNEFVILDEPDAKASETNAIKFFKTLTKISDFKQVFTVTHREKAKEYLVESGANVFDVKNGVVTRSS